MRLSSLVMPLLLLGCAARKDLVVLEQPLPKLSASTVALLPTVVLSELPGALAEGEDAFNAGLYVGNVHHSGGYIFLGAADGEEAGMPVRSKEIELLAADSYRSAALAWMDAQFTGALTQAGLQVMPVAAPDPSALPLPRRSPRRGTDPLDGTDNVNLPRFDLAPTAWPQAPSYAGGADVVIMPVLVLYYSHNGGWFVGQRMGCGSGARLRAFWAYYDGKTGAPLGWEDVEARHIDPYLMSPNTSQLEDHLIAVEERVGKELRKRVAP